MCSTGKKFSASVKFCVGVRVGEGLTFVEIFTNAEGAALGRNVEVNPLTPELTLSLLMSYI
jgi:hypothetical protein